MPRWFGTWCACVLLAVGAVAALAEPAAPGAAPQPPGETSAAPGATTVRDEAERLRKAAAEAEAAAPDEAARTRVRLQLITDLLLLVIRQQEEISLQNQALLATLTNRMAGTSAGATGLRVAPSATKGVVLPGKPAGPLFGRRGGGGKVHRPGCPFGERIAVSSRVMFATLAQAAAAGLQPCKVCRPGR